MEKIPERSIDLIKELDEAYPLRLPRDLNFNEKDVAFIMGQRDVINRLLYLMNYKEDEGELPNVF